MPAPEKHPDAVVARARLIHSRGYSTEEVADHLADEGVYVSLDTLRGWLRWTTRTSAGGPSRVGRADRPDPYDERRIDIIGQNGPTGEHYAAKE